MIGERYEDLGPIGAGGMAEVRRVHDHHLDRVLAMKIVHRRLQEHADALRRFQEEARVTARLQHPNIVPVHELGTLPDGRLWFTMKEVRGRTLRDAIDEVHEASSDRWAAGADGWTLRRLVGAFLAVCRAVAHAHEAGVVHRDLKPSNVMVGEHGEVYVLDWGLARLLADVRDVGRRVVQGTPAYMAPEQAAGDLARIGPHTDVYALGAMLYQILAGRPPRAPSSSLEGARWDPVRPLGRGPTVSTLLTWFDGNGDVPDAPPEPVGSVLPLPDELVALCDEAMRLQPEDRVGSAAEVAARVEAWLDGARRREQGLELVELALTRAQESAELRSEAERVRAAGRSRLDALERWRPEEDKAPAWAELDRADALDRRAFLVDLEAEQGLQAALRLEPDLPEAHAALADRARRAHAACERDRDRDGAARHAVLLASHAEALPADHEARRAATIWLRGDGALTLVTEPAGARVTLSRYVERRRRLVLEEVGVLGVTPLVGVSVPRGSYRLRLERPGHHPVELPVLVERCQHVEGTRPGDPAPTPVPLLPLGELEEGEVYVPPGRGDAPSPTCPSSST